MLTPAFKPIRSPHTTFMYTIPIRRLREILKHVDPKVTLTSVEEVSSRRLPRLYNLNLLEDKKLVLSFSPSLSVKLLRHEQQILLSEATLIHLLTSMTRLELDKGTTQSEHSMTASQASRVTSLARLIPTLLKHSSNTREIGLPYTIFEPAVGEPLSSLLIYLSLPEQRYVDKQIGLLVRDLALINSPSGRFGTVPRVCGDPFAPGHATSSSAYQSSTNWTDAFMRLVEAILRDGEDMSVLLPYEVIRGHFQRLAWRLSAVTVPRLLVIDAGDPTNVLIERDADEDSSSTTAGPRVTGLRDWSQGVFGDPLLSSCFEDPSEGFLEGWRRDGAEDIVEDREGGVVRLLLYRCYRATVDIVTEYYRTQPDSSRRELEGRRKLTNVLTELNRVDVEQTDFTKRSRSCSESGPGEASKRQRLETAQA